jgi:hypothetical protein
MHDGRKDRLVVALRGLDLLNTFILSGGLNPLNTVILSGGLNPLNTVILSAASYPAQFLPEGGIENSPG